MTKEGNVKYCPITKDTWEARAEESHCGGLNSYHCLTDNKGGKWERCVEKARIKEGNCPIFTSKGFIDWKQCNISMTTCPNISYVSNEVYKYPGCFGNNSIYKESVVDDNKAEDTFNWSVIGIVLGTIFILAAALIIFIVYVRRNQFHGVSKEIVKKNHVFSACRELLNNQVRSIVTEGNVGSSVFSTSRLISETFAKKKNWRSMECRYLDIPDPVEENTIMFVYGWFGLWNDDLCSVDKVKTACQSLIKILHKTNNVKIIVGIRTELYEKYIQALYQADGQIRNLFYRRICLDSLDVRKDAEYMNYIKKNIKKPCGIKDCACKKLTYDHMHRKGEDRVVGMPLKINIIQRYHELIPSYLDNWDILMVMRDHFTSIGKDKEKRYVYEWIMYICLKGKFCRSDPYDTTLVNKMSFKIMQSSFDKDDKELCRYIRMRNSDKLMKVLPENAQYVLWHPFIYICAFHCLFHTNPQFVMKHCNEDAILQLVRPEGFKTSYIEVTANDLCVTLFNERMHLLGKKEEYAQHPLMNRSTENTETSEPIADTPYVTFFNETMRPHDKKGEYKHPLAELSTGNAETDQLITNSD